MIVKLASTLSAQSGNSSKELHDKVNIFDGLTNEKFYFWFCVVVGTMFLVGLFLALRTKGIDY